MGSFHKGQEKLSTWLVHHWIKTLQNITMFSLKGIGLFHETGTVSCHAVCILGVCEKLTEATWEGEIGKHMKGKGHGNKNKWRIAQHCKQQYLGCLRGYSVVAVK